jgi:hypothetical protein
MREMTSITVAAPPEKQKSPEKGLKRMKSRGLLEIDQVFN